jgi:hypothetical protein
VFLGRAVGFSVLAGSSINNTGQTVVEGSMGIAPGTDIIGFPRSTVQANTRAATNAQFDLTAAYNEAAARTNATAFPGTSPVTPGLYSAAALTVPPEGLVLDAQGDPTAVFVFQIGSALTVPPDSGVFLTGAARAANIFWQVGDSATVGANSRMNGTIMANQSITLGSRATLDGRALARNGAVTLDRNVITLPIGGTTNDVPLDIAVLTPISFNPQTGLFEQRVRVLDVGTSTNAFLGIAVLIRGLPTDVRVYNGNSGRGFTSPFVTHDFPVASGESVDFVIEYYRATRQAFTPPTYSPTITVPGSSNPRGRIFSIDRTDLVQGDRMLIEFTAEVGRRYVVQYNTNAASTTTWRTVDPAITAAANRVQWFDDGPPKTESPPGPVGNRFYRVVELP